MSTIKLNHKALENDIRELLAQKIIEDYDFSRSVAV